MPGSGEPGPSSRGRPLREAARTVAVLVAALLGGAGLLFLITQLVAQPRLTAPPRTATASLASPTPPLPSAALPALPEGPVPPPPPPTAPGSAVPDQYLGDLTTDQGVNSGDIDGVGYRFTHGFGMSLDTTTRETFIVPAGYQSLTASLKGLGGTIRFTLSVGGQTILDRTLSPYQSPVVVTCAAPPGSTIVLAGLFEGGGSLSDAAAVWGDARFSTSPAPSAGCS
jgi:hypothetical protein